MSSRVRFIDVGLNLTDPVFRGLHRGKRKHRDDILDVIKRAKAAGVQSAILTGGSLHESSEALDLAAQFGYYATVGCHPTRSSQFDSFKGGPEVYLERLDQLIASHLTGTGRCVAVGECGLDYDRLHFSPIVTQQKHFRSQLSLAKKYHLPLFLHVRAAHEDFVRILKEEGFGEDGGRACEWVFDENGPKSRDNKGYTPSSIDGRNCCQPEKFIEGRVVKGRNEPCAIGGVAWVVASLKNRELIDVSRAAWNNTVEMYDLHELMDAEYHEDIAARDASKDKPVENGGVVDGGAMDVKTEAKEVDPTEKKIRILKKKLQAIEQLKARRDNGDSLEATQLQKIEGEADLLKQLEELEKS
ncbi:TatD DNase family protein [Rhizoctonia solani]|uniref:TatD DNase family protein n=1 Tax=Rhizoctonia solani TaxID=456999 RepID=A0A8H8P6W4_9AGAM|nr:TatD DNase family protein [Rhizoctonia solani]QRW24647.1 TatD DNase family protein [Rhizoctonia solani]